MSLALAEISLGISFVFVTSANQFFADVYVLLISPSQASVLPFAVVAAGDRDWGDQGGQLKSLLIQCTPAP